MFNSNKLKVQLKLVGSRLKIVQQKCHADSQNVKREIAHLLEKGKIESARIKVEHVISQDFQSEALEITELYCDLLLARFGLVEEFSKCEESIAEAVSSIIYAAPRLGVKELMAVRDLFISKYGRDFAISAMENRGECVNHRLITKLKTGTPDKALVDKYLQTIASHYNISYSVDSEADAQKKDASLVTPMYREDLEKSNSAKANPVKAPLKAKPASEPYVQPVIVKPIKNSVATLSPPPVYDESAAPSAPASTSDPQNGQKANSVESTDELGDSFEDLQKRINLLKKGE